MGIKAKVLFLSVLLASGAASAYTFKPAVAYDKSGKNDRSFNEAVFRDGVQRFEQVYAVDIFELEPIYRASLKKGINELAAKGYSPIVTVGFNSVDIVQKVAKRYPKIQFVTIDAVVDLPNVQSVVFKEQEGSFLVGALAAMYSKTGTVGFIGGMDVPLIRKFGCGYAQGAQYINSDINVLREMTGSTPSAFKNPEKGGKLALQQMNDGADVIFAAAGQTGQGVFTATKFKQQKVIGVDSNQNWIYPGYVLTSMVKDVGGAAFKSWEDARNGKWKSGITVMGLKEGGVDWVLDNDNRSLISPEMEQRMTALKAGIISGDIQVHDYMSDQNCPI